jgi:hypothetical protein
MPAKRRTRNIRYFEYEFRAALSTHNLSRAQFDDPNTPLNTKRDVLQYVADELHKATDAVQFYSHGDGTRVAVTGAARDLALARFLARTVQTMDLGTVVVKPRNQHSPWIESYNPQSPTSSDSDSSSDEPDSTDGSSDDGEPQSTQGDAADDAADTATDAEKTVEKAAQMYPPSDSDSPNPLKDEFAKWWRKLAELREYCKAAAEQGLPIDDFESYRPGVMGARMIAQGITADACADAATAHWPQDARDELNIQAIPVNSVIAAPENTHPATGYLIALMRAKVPALLHGGAGVGKTTLARTVAEIYGLDFGMVSMTAGLSTTALTGSVNLQGFVTRPCINTFEHGGVFLFDEMDAADANLMLLTNTMLANDEFQSPVTGERIFRNERWYPIAAVNTLNGASTSYTGRTRLDHATMDRWRMGRIRLDFDTRLALDYALDVLGV